MHKLLTDDPGRRMLLLGNESIARGAVEAGLAVGATYPGTPSSEISLNLFQISRETDLYFEYSVNEKVAMELAAAAANSGLRSMCIMKHVGLNVAADALMTLAYVGVRGGMVILVADDPFMFSSQNEQDSRYYGKLSGLPILEPSTIQEAREMTAAAFDLSESLRLPVIVRTTTRINHSTAVVTLGELKERKRAGDFARDPMNLVTVPAVSRRLHAKLLGQMEKAGELSSASSYNFIEGSGKWGVICNGVSYGYVADAAADLKIADQIAILRIGFSHPMPETLIKEFLRSRDKVLVVEEGEPVMEESVKAMAQEAGLTIPIAGKGKELFSRLYEYDPALVRKMMARYFGVPSATAEAGAEVPDLPQRPPTLCAGCSHRAVFYAVKAAAQGMDVIYPTDIGCYTLGLLPPLKMADFLICMGSSTSTSCGFSTATGKKVVSFIGDSTFFHSGLAGLVNAVFNGHKFTLVILDNGTTAMTGHQPHPGVDMARLGLDGHGRISIEEVVRAIGVPHVAVIHPFKVRQSVETLKEAFAFDGLSVVIAQELCTLYSKKLKIQKKRAFHVSDKCTGHRRCIDMLGCPAFYLDGGRVAIDADRCVGCAVCAHICPENAIVPVKDNKQG